MGEARLEWAGWAYRGVCIPHPGDSRPGAFFEVGQRACDAGRWWGWEGVIDMSVPLRAWSLRAWLLKARYRRWSWW